MRHNLTLTGFAFRLRPITDADAALVLDLRSNLELNQYLHVGAMCLPDQLAWFARYYERQGDYYFVIERLDSGVAQGVISIYDIDPQLGCGEWGRWIVKPGSLAAVETAWLIYRCAFELLALKRVFCRTVANNIPVISFHDSCGILNRKILFEHFDLGGKMVDAVEHQVDQQAWAVISPQLEKLARLTARRLHRE